MEIRNFPINFFMRIISWNCQGIGNKDSLRVLKDLLSQHRPNSLVLIETKISERRADVVCGKIGFDSWVRVEAYGFSKGIWLFWHSHALHLNLISSDAQIVHCQIKCTNGCVWLFTMVYGSPNVSSRNRLCDHLRLLGKSSNLSWLLIGDFNIVQFTHECSNALSVTISRDN